MRIAIDAMGGDHAPKEIVKGALAAIKAYHDLHIVLVGNENGIRPFLTDILKLQSYIQKKKIESTFTCSSYS
ncbi:hypothetical protein KHA80_19575 [Anaerobacillus sp. HL2]|nr:hypothetical protein KHA80_19575 [Anaerobacillus sp. HL2]